MGIVYFKEENHHYFNEKGRQYTSVSGLWKPYSKKFDGPLVATKIAMKELDLKSYNITKKEVGYESSDFVEAFFDTSNIDKEVIQVKADLELSKWAAKTQHGTDFHNKMEALDYERGYRENPFTGKKSPIITWDKRGYDNMSSPTPLIDLPDGYVAEHLVKSDKYEIGGQIDGNWIETIGRTRYIDIDDYKTDKEIVEKPTFWNPKRGGFEKMYYPVDHIYATNYWKYVMKISTYAKFLQDAGFVVRNLSITHIVADENLQIVHKKQYKIPYKEFEVTLVLEDFLKKVA